MKYRLWILLLALSLATVGGVASVAAAAQYSEKAAVSKNASPDPADMGYTLARCGGRIGLYRGDELIYTTDVDVSGLRRVDRELIENGITAETYEDALALLEDFGD